MGNLLHVIVVHKLVMILPQMCVFFLLQMGEPLEDPEDTGVRLEQSSQREKHRGNP